MLANNPRTVMMTRNLQRFGANERAAIRKTAEEMRDRPDLI